MRKFLLFLFLFIAKVSFSQINESFTDGDFTQNPVWTADLSTNFVVLNQQLRSNSTTASSNFYISTPNTKALNCNWEFDINLQFSTSGANYVDVYLVSNVADLKSTNINGYFLRMGNTADEVALYRRSGATTTSVKIIDGVDGSVGNSNNNFKFRITRTSAGFFNLERDATGTGSSFISEGTVTDNTFTTTSSFGFLVQQSTSTFHQKHFFDNVIIQDIIVDNTPPILNTLVVNSGTQIILNFNEAVNATDAAILNHYVVDPSNIQPSSVTVMGSNVVLNFANEFNTGTFTLTVNTIKDLAGNAITAPINRSFNYRRPYTAKLNDIVINEIFADPSPQIDLPTVEFIEIYNKSSEDISLKDFTYTDGTSTFTFANDSLMAGKYLILCARADTAEYKAFGKVLGISPWPSLNNASDQLILKNQNGVVISSVSYADTWYRDNVKKSGGWTLERIDPFSKCVEALGWTASKAIIGGTPGKQNSVFIANYDALTFKVDSFKKETDSTLVFNFSKPLEALALNKANFELQPNITIKNISTDISNQQIKLLFDKDFAPATSYQIVLKNLSDCSQNNMSGTNTFTFKTPALRPDTAKIFITEIFADPSPEMGLPLAEFVEIYNAGKDTVDLKDFTLSNGGTGRAKISSRILPNDYIIFCSVADTLQYQPFGKVVGISSFPSLTNSVGTVILRSHTGKLIDSISYSDQWYRDNVKKAGGWTLERIDPYSKCVGALGWTASKAIIGGTPGKQNSVFIANYDALTFKVDSFKKETDSTLVFNFNKPLEALALNKNNFELQPSIIVKNISADISNQQVKLLFDKNFAPATSYQIILKNLIDCSQNTLSGTNTFTFKTPALRPDTAKIFITEIFADPSPEVGLPLAEFVEIYNTSKDTVDLKDFSLSNGGTGRAKISSRILPNQYIILCSVADTLQYQPFGKVVGISSFPSLTNNVGTVIVRSHTGKLIDSVFYSDEWYKDAVKKIGGYTLEKIDLNQNQCNPFYNWAASKNVKGGTPGSVNSISKTFATANDLAIENISILNDSTVRVSLNFYPDTSRLAQFKFTTSLLREPKYIVFDKNDIQSFTLTYGQLFKEATTYQISPTGIANCSGLLLNRSASFTTPFITSINYPVVINEIFADPIPVIGLPEVEFFELKNLSNSTVSLAGMIYENDRARVVFNQGSIEPNGFVIVCPARDTLSYQTFGKTIGLSSFPSLNNNSSVLTLKNSKGVEFYKVAYDISWYGNREKQNGGYTLELIDPASLCGGKQNWLASNSQIGGTPGKENSIHLINKTNIPFQLLNASIKDSLTISLTFNRALDSLQATLPNQYAINNGVGIPQIVTPIAPNFSTIDIKYNQALSRNQTYTITVNGVTDCGGNTLASQTQSFVYTGAINRNDILINEILFNPRSGGVDFVEVYNNSNKILDFKDLSIATTNDRDSLISIRAVSATTLLFQPQTYWVITSNPDTVKAQYQTQNPNNFIKINSLPSYNDDSGRAILLNKINARVDQFNYNNKMHFALLRDFNGVSLERSSFSKPTNEKGNFRSAAANVGYATPGYQNSQLLPEVTSEEEISLVSETFSPDNDGFEDVLRILYKFNQADRAANVNIYNDQGRLMKKLIRNEITASQGEWIWDGLDENNAKVKTGIYILYIELFDLSGNVKKYKKTAVAASRFD